MRKISSILALSSVVLALGVGSSLAEPEVKSASESPSGETAPTAKHVYNSDTEAEPLTEGEKIPSVEVKKPDGSSVNLKEAVAGKKSIIVFYRGGWCPYCNRHLADLAKIQPELLENGYQIIAISPDSPESLKGELEKRELPYSVYSDNNFKATTAFGIAYRVSDETNKRLMGYNINLNKWSGQEQRILPVPALFMTDENGKLTYVHANPDYKVRLSGDEVLKAAGIEVKPETE